MSRIGYRGKKELGKWYWLTPIISTELQACGSWTVSVSLFIQYSEQYIRSTHSLYLINICVIEKKNSLQQGNHSSTKWAIAHFLPKAGKFIKCLFPGQHFYSLFHRPKELSGQVPIRTCHTFWSFWIHPGFALPKVMPIKEEEKKHNYMKTFQELPVDSMLALR